MSKSLQIVCFVQLKSKDTQFTIIEKTQISKQTLICDEAGTFKCLAFWPDGNNLTINISFINIVKQLVNRLIDSTAT